MSKLLKYDKKFEYNDPFKRFINTRNISRVIIPIMLLNACISIINNIPYSFYVIIPVFIVVVLLGGGIYLFKPKYNLLNHVRMAAQKDEEYEKVIMYIQESLNKLSDECDNIFIVAHSQGGYLMYQILSRNLLKKKSNIMFISLGSGLKAIFNIKDGELFSRFIFYVKNIPQYKFYTSAYTSVEMFYIQHNIYILMRLFHIHKFGT